MIQGSAEWHKWRLGGLGASEAPAILGIDKYKKTPYKLWLLKTGRQADEPQSEFVTDLGHKFEPAVRADLELKLLATFEPICAQHNDHEWLRCSFDGYCDELGTFQEIKMVGEKVFQEITKTNELPPHHYAQMQHQFMVSGFDYAYYSYYRLDFQFTKIEEINHIKVYRDDKFIKKYFEKAQDFWGCVVTDNPPPLTDLDAVVITDPEAIQRAELFVSLTESLELVQKSYDELKEILYGMCSHPRTEIGSLLITKGKRNSIKIKKEKDGAI